jgi:hypothetical protein
MKVPLSGLAKWLGHQETVADKVSLMCAHSRCNVKPVKTFMLPVKNRNLKLGGSQCVSRRGGAW